VDLRRSLTDDAEFRSVMIGMREHIEAWLASEG